MAVHGTRRGESVSWDYEGLLQLLSSLARERSGLPLLRCYWYEATLDGRRTAEQDALADVPGVKLRVAKIRPGRREGVEAEINRDLSTLARNHAISDALVVSAEEDLAQVIADVQDLGMRVTLMRIAADGTWTTSRALRQECDDVLEISGDHLRPYAEPIAGTVPPPADEVDDGRAAALPLANGHSTAPAASYQVPAAGTNHEPPAVYAMPVAGEYQRPAAQLPGAPGEMRDAQDDQVREERARGEWAREERAREERPAPPAFNGEPHAPVRPDIAVRPEGYAASPASAPSWPDRQEPAPQDPAARGPLAEQVSGYPEGRPGTPETAPPAPAAAEPPTAQLRRLPSSRTLGGENPTGPSAAVPGPGQHAGPPQSSQAPARGAAYSGPQPVLPSAPPGYQASGGVSLSDAVQAAHEEGQEFGGSVARDAPALWLEAVLARKPRMPSDLEARLLQGSALPIDFLLHEEVRHALRRGFWDALERTRR